MTEHDDDEIIQDFAAMRRVDALAAPQFDTLLGRHQPQRTRSRLLRAVIITAAAAAIVLAVGVHYSNSRQNVVPPIETSILDWRSPTASLLETPDHELLHTVPALTSSLFSDLTLSPADK